MEGPVDNWDIHQFWKRTRSWVIPEPFCVQSLRNRHGTPAIAITSGHKFLQTCALFDTQELVDFPKVFRFDRVLAEDVLDGCGGRGSLGTDRCHHPRREQRVHDVYMVGVLNVADAGESDGKADVEDHLYDHCSLLLVGDFKDLSYGGVELTPFDQSF